MSFRSSSPFSYNSSLKKTAKISIEDILVDKKLIEDIKKGIEKFGSPRTMSEESKNEVDRLIGAIPGINLPPSASPQKKSDGEGKSDEEYSSIFSSEHTNLTTPPPHARRGVESIHAARMRRREAALDTYDQRMPLRLITRSERLATRDADREKAEKQYKPYKKKYDQEMREAAFKDGWTPEQQLIEWGMLDEARNLSVQDKKTQSFRTRKKSIRRKTQKRKNNKKKEEKKRLNRPRWRGGKKKRTKRRRKKRTKKKGKYNKCVKFFTKRHRVTKKKALNMCRVMFG
jgi:hypothetical protein